MLGRRFVRLLGTALAVLGVVVLAWGFVIWQWGDPVTGAYTWWQQRRLADAYEQVVQRYPLPRDPRPVSSRRVERDVRAVARRLRLEAPPGAPIGRIRVPRLGLKMLLVNGTDSSSLRRGPGRDLRTYMPGEGELVYIAGHRTTYGAPFAHIDRMRTGDRVELDMPYGRFMYAVTMSVIVPADDLARLRSRNREEIALQACHPRFSARERYIVYARPISRGKGVAS